MVRSISVDKKKRGRGRPATGQKPAISARVTPDVLKALLKWAVANGYSESEAICVLLARQLGLKVD